MRDVLAEGIERRGSSIDDYTAPEGDGEMQEHLQVYQRTGPPCDRCGRPVKRFVLGIRATHFCSWCQRLPQDERTPGNLALAAHRPRHERPARHALDASCPPGRGPWAPGRPAPVALAGWWQIVSPPRRRADGHRGRPSPDRVA